LCQPTFCVLPPLLRVFLEAESVAAAGLSPEVVVLAAEPEVVVLAAGPGVFALVFEAAGLFLEVAVLAAEPEAVSVVDLEVSEPGVVFVAVVSVADVAEPQVSVDIAVAFAALVPASAVVVEVDSSGRPTFVAFPNVDCYATSASSVEVVGDQFVHSATGARTSCGLCSILSSLGLHHNKNLEHSCNNPSLGCNTVSDTNDLPMDATTSHSRKTSLHLSQEQRKHRVHQVSLSQPEVRRTQWVAVDQYLHLYLPVPWLEEERQLPTPKALL
jgi:hypothetical protein